MQKPNLFADFHKNTAKEWKQQIQYTLKGEDYNEKLVWESPEGIKVKPFYHYEDTQGSTSQINFNNTTWRIGESLQVLNAQNANKKALELLKMGAESLFFTIENEHISIETLLKNIPLSKIQLHFELQFLSFNYINTIITYTKDKNATIFFNVDLIGNLSRTGNWFVNQEHDHQTLNKILSLKSPFLLRIDTTLYQNAGANMVQQLAYALAHANEYLNHINSLDQSQKNPQTFTFKVAIGSNYFFEISKLRALRLLWKTLAAEYHVNENCHIVAIPSKRNKTLYAYNNNMIRTTLECMAAALGGADTIKNLTYDSIYHKDNTFARRIALNQLILLKEESDFSTSNMIADGAYYIESITEQLASKALDLFKTLEKGGGFLAQLKSHTLQKKIKESAQKEQDLFDENESILVGINAYENLQTKMSDTIECYPFVKTKARKTLIEPIIEKRLSEKWEKQRLASE